MAPPIDKVTVIGTGLIGSGWATQFVLAGYSVNLYDSDVAQLEDASRVVESNLTFLREKGVRITDVKGALRSLTTTRDLPTAVAGVSFIQESIIENLDAKRDLLAEIDKYANDDAVFASSNEPWPAR